MKGSSAAVLTRRDWIWTLLPVLIWVGQLQLRPHVMQLHCSKSPELCAVEKLTDLERLAVVEYSGRVDEASFLTQNLSGALAVGVPALSAALAVWRGAASLGVAAVTLGTDFVLLVQAWAWNGVAMETARLSVQRPRPFVYQDPARLGGDPAHYTSFYSGHASFAALASVCLFFTLRRHGFPTWALGLQLAVGATLTLSTGYLRVATARHFPTDVLFGMLAGGTIAIIVSLSHRKRRVA